MTQKTLKRNIIQRILGIPATKPPADPGCWTVEDGKLVVDLQRAPELSEPWGAAAFEGENLPQKVLVILDGSNVYRAFHNHCEHGGRMLDPVPDSNTVQCCSVGKSVFGYDGTVISGSADKPITIYDVSVEDGKLVIQV
jgi:nitrite reductase/ring-hydroxylating ferredoxin subunit